MITMRDMFIMGSVTMLLGVLCVAHLLGYSITFGGFFAALAASPFLGVGFVLGMLYLAEWSERRTRARRIACAKARKGEGV